MSEGEKQSVFLLKYILLDELWITVESTGLLPHTTNAKLHWWEKLYNVHISFFPIIHLKITRKAVS